MNRTLKRATATLAVTLSAALGSAHIAQATDYSGYTLNQLRADCLANGETQNPYSSPGNYVPATYVGQGSQGICTALAQALLNARAGTGCVGNSGLTVDGIDGPLTTAAVVCIQKDANLQQDGIVGPYTWAVIWYDN